LDWFRGFGEGGFVIVCCGPWVAVFFLALGGELWIGGGCLNWAGWSTVFLAVVFGRFFSSFLFFFVEEGLWSFRRICFWG